MEEKNDDLFILEESLKTVRRCRKKLRQIERLETIGRTLSPEEVYKVSTKADIRAKLQEIMAVINQHDESLNSTSDAPKSPEENGEDVDNAGDGRNELMESGSLDVLPECKIDHDEQNRMKDEELLPTPPKKRLQEAYSDFLTSTPQVFSTHSSESASKENKQRKLRKLWKSKMFELTSLEGHNDVVCDVDVHSGWLVTGSRDTSVKLWQMSTCEELRNMSGHTGSVTCVRLLNEHESNKIRQVVTTESNELVRDVSLKAHDHELLLLTASTDCSIKLWLLPQGCLIKSIYNFSPVTAMLLSKDVVFVGSDTGKITAYNIVTGNQLYEKMIHENMITNLKTDENILLSSCTDGNLKLWNVSNANDERTLLKEIGDEFKLILKYALANSESYQEGRQILSACFHNNKVIFGDDGINLKVLDVESGLIEKYPNHIAASGFSDDLCVFNNVLFSTSYNLDTGVGSLNIRHNTDANPYMYLTTLVSDDLPRLLCCKADTSSQSKCFVTGGSKLFVWRETTASSHKESIAGPETRIRIKGRSFLELNRTDVSTDLESDATGDEGVESSKWWWSKPVETGSKQLNEEESDSDSETDGKPHATEATSNNDSRRWWCSVV